VDVNVLPMDHRTVLRRQVVIVRGGFVTRIGPVGVVEVPRGARVIDGGGTQFLAPGLTDAHVHLSEDPEELKLFIATGVTTVFNLEGAPYHLRLRERVASGELIGPTIYTSGPFINGDNTRSPSEARKAVQYQSGRSYDFIKVHGDLSAETFEALSTAGADYGIPIVGHAPRNLPFSAVLRNRQAVVSHAEELIYTQFMTLNPAELATVADAMADAGTWLTPGLTTFENIASQWGAPERLQAVLDGLGAQFLPPAMRRDWASSQDYIEMDPLERPRLQEMLAFHGPLIRTFQQAGVPMLTGTDAGMPGMVPGFSLHDEIAALADVGLSRHQALSAATENAGRFVRDRVDQTANFGRVRQGARADLILLEQNPLDDLDALRRLEGVMVRGRWFDRAALDRMLAEAGAGN